MEVESAKKHLKIEGEFDSEKVKAAYIDCVKEARDEEDFETSLLNLNIARDTLLGSQSSGRELVPVMVKELAAISAKQNELMQINNARDEIRETFGSVERRSVNRIKGTRDITGLLSAASAALAFGKDNLSVFLPSLTDATLYTQTLILCSATLAFFAFMANRRAGEVSSRMDELNRNLTRDRQISRLLLYVFRDNESLSEIEFETRLKNKILASPGVRNRSTELDRVFDFYGAIGLPAPINIHLGHDFFDDYIDYLTKSGHVNATGISGHDMTFHKVK